MTLVLNGTTGVSAVDGSASTPAIQGNDTNTGVFFPAADTVAVATGGSERVRVDSSGNVGVGTSSPGARLHVQTSAGYNAYFQTSGTSVRINYLNDAASANVSAAYRATDFAWQKSDGAEVARIDSSGNLLVGTTSTISGARVGIANVNGGQAGLGIGNTAGSSLTTTISFRNSNGEVGTIQTSGSTTSYNTSSDYRLKENIQPMQNALAVVQQLKPVTYNWKVDGSDGQGFIAHELQEVVPDCVTGEKDAVDAEGNPIYQGVDTSFLVATLTAAIQELNAKVESLTAEIATLKGAQA